MTAVREAVRAARDRRHLWPALATVLLLALPGGRWQVAGGQIAVADLASVALVAGGAVVLARGHRPPPHPAAVLLLAAPAVAFAVVTMASGDPVGSLPGFLRCLQVFVLVPLAVVLLPRDRRDARLVAGALVVLALAQGAVGTAQYVTKTGASYMGQDVRAVGTFGPLSVMGMATVVSYGLIAALCLGLAGPGRPRWRAAALGAAAALALPLAFSFSRGAWLATAAAVATVVAVPLVAGSRPARRVLLPLLLCGGALLAGGAALGSAGMIGERLGSIGDVTGTPDQSVIDRYAMWDAAWSMWRDAPWTGTGPKGFAEYRDSHASLALSGGSDTGGAGFGFQRQELLSPHNMYLLLLSEQGLVGATSVLGCWAALAARCLVRLRRAARGGGPLDVGLLAVGLLVWQAVNFLYADIGGAATVLTAVALGLAAWWAFSPAAVAPAVRENG
ncbi:O-antigen ligase family protein [Streptomyces specialis]|uniref:O-antigen ligase family protein n=1 Tax=Streptomyces specialis TaxID=498367 RepID=UPI00073F9453|nr:O-antigen ligase family protein [Streptomyces specialis]